MATLSFDKINKIITVDAPDTEITIQELINLIRDWEDELENLETPKVADASGKEGLGGGVSVGITVTLIDWYLTFEARSGPTWELCSISGGNLVRYDTGTLTYGNPISPSAYTTITLTSSSSATLQEIEAIQYSSYDGKVIIDIVNGVSGTTFPIGTLQSPVNNVTDAKTIANDRGINILYIQGSLVLASGEDISGYSISSSNILNGTIVNINGITTGCSFTNITAVGLFINISFFNSCALVNVTTDGIILYCSILGTFTPYGSGDPILLIDSVAANSSYGNVIIIDMSLCNTSFSGTGVSGEFKITNVINDNLVTMDFYAGKLELASTVTTGTFSIRGISCFINNSGVGATIDNCALLSNVSITNSVWDEATSNHETIGTTGKALIDAAAGGVLTGSNTVTLTIYKTSTSTPISDIAVEIWNNNLTNVLTVLRTDINGQTQFTANDGNYKVKMKKAGWAFSATESLVVSGDTSQIYYGDSIIELLPPIALDTCRIYEYLYGVDALPVQAAKGIARIVSLPFGDGVMYTNDEVEGLYNSETGLIYWDIVWGAVVKFIIPDFDITQPKTIPELTTKRLSDL